MPIPAMLALMSAAAAPGATAPFDLASRTVVATLHAEGAQVYECKAGANGGAAAWTFREPIATLIDDGKTVGRHYAGPHWALDDGSLVQGRLAQSVPGATATDIPALALDVIQNDARGRLAPVTRVYRIDTAGGALQGACGQPGALRSMPYAADYVFAR